MSKRIFISYARKNSPELKTLLSILRPSLSTCDVSVWHDEALNAGDEFNQRLEYECSISDAIVFLVSNAFLASEYCQTVELVWSMKLASELDVLLIPLILEPCSWQNTILKHFNATPRDGKPVTGFPTMEDGFSIAAADIKNAVNSSQSYLWKLQPINSIGQSALTTPSSRVLGSGITVIGEIGSTVAKVGNYAEDILEALGHEPVSHLDEHDHGHEQNHSCDHEQGDAMSADHFDDDCNDVPENR